MGKKKDKDETPNPANVGNRDILQRLNFLYQASVLLNGLVPAIPDDRAPSTSSSLLNDDNASANTAPSNEGDPSHPPQPQQKKRRRIVGFEELSRSYIETMKCVGQKTNVRMDPSVKRRICKRCSAPLVPGISATVRIQDSTSHGHLVSYRCHCCQAERRIPAPPVLRMDPPTSEDTMETQPDEAPDPNGESVCRRRQKRRKGEPQRRLPPHFARDVGHVVFRGNEQLDKPLSVA